MAYPKCLVEMRKQLGEHYQIQGIDFELCLYRNFGNGFDVEISGVYSRKRKANRRITIWLWWIGKKQDKKNSAAQAICDVYGIPYDASAIHAVTEFLYEFSNKLLAEGHNVNDKIDVIFKGLSYDEFIRGTQPERY